MLLRFSFLNFFYFFSTFILINAFIALQDRLLQQAKEKLFKSLELRFWTFTKNPSAQRELRSEKLDGESCVTCSQSLLFLLSHPLRTCYLYLESMLSYMNLFQIRKRERRNPLYIWKSKTRRKHGFPERCKDG